jgi:hypothetical protein
MADVTRNLTTNIRTVGAEQAVASFLAIAKGEQEAAKHAGVLAGEFKKVGSLFLPSTAAKEFNNEIEKIPPKAKKAAENIERLQRHSRDLGNTMVNAQGTLINFNRIVQDAPYGIQGVSNNITFFAETFAALSKQAGGAKGALVAMLNSLKGAGGWLFAISLATTVMQMFTSSMKDNEGQAESSREKLESLAKAMREYTLATDDAISKQKEFRLEEAKTELARLQKELGKERLEGVVPITGVGMMPRAVELSERGKRIQEAIKGTEVLIKQLTQQVNLSSADFEKYANDIKSWAASVKRLNDEGSIKIFIQQMGLTAPQVKAVSDELKRQADQFGALSPEAQRYNRLIESLNKILRPDKIKETTNKLKEQTTVIPFLTLLYGNMVENIAKMQSTLAQGTSLLDPKTLFVGMQKEGNKPFDDNAISNMIKNDDNIKAIEFFADTFQSTLSGAGIQAFEDMFGEANSLLEKFLAKLFDAAAMQAGMGLLGFIANMIIPGAGAFIAPSFFSKPASGGTATIVNVKIGDQTIQKVFNAHTPNAVKRAQFLREL